MTTGLALLFAASGVMGTVACWQAMSLESVSDGVKMVFLVFFLASAFMPLVFAAYAVTGGR